MLKYALTILRKSCPITPAGRCCRGLRSIPLIFAHSFKGLLCSPAVRPTRSACSTAWRRARLLLLLRRLLSSCVQLLAGAGR